MSDVVEVYKDQAGEWRWRRLAANHETVADSGEGYNSRTYCVEMAERINRDADIVVRKD